MKSVGWAILFLQLQACGGSTPKKLMIQYEASAQMNPDLNLRPSPLVINSYQLSSLNSFQEADFFSLYDQAKTVLGKELLYQDQIEIKPNQVLKTEQDYFDRTKYLAFIAAFRDIDHAVWKKIIAIKPKEKKPILVLLSAEEMEVKK